MRVNGHVAQILHLGVPLGLADLPDVLIIITDGGGTPISIDDKFMHYRHVVADDRPDHAIDVHGLAAFDTDDAALAWLAAMRVDEATLNRCRLIRVTSSGAHEIARYKSEKVGRTPFAVHCFTLRGGELVLHSSRHVA
jgi:hypothetical protein